jgi:hypothetical protein
MSYKSQMNELKKNREKYFPLMEMLLYAESSYERSDPPMKIADINHIATILELIDIGYLSKDSFIIEKHRGDINGLFYNGNYPLTDSGVKVYRQNLHEKRGKLVRTLMFVVLLFLAMVVFFMIAW